ncbi:hypothetical protein GIB67_006070 [Kingdonia uniflora]|uniref:Cytochrome b561 domain-containing protein n=1 Tax=Kingdonia uniflora TaxID=39325 RepID=A0A7J7LPU5_9MAGN|nr:hypothetical protein GIB67_006070 [Kingdonia uniflora]
MDHTHKAQFRRIASRVTIVAHLFGLIAGILLLIWLLHYRGGLDLHSNSTDRIFNVHPFLMFGFILMAGEAMMAYRTVTAEHKVQKFFHSAVHLIAFVLGIIGIHAVFKYHNKVGLADMYSLHSWLGMGAFCLFGLQWLFGVFSFWLPNSSTQARERILPFHVFGGRTLLYLTICVAETGLMEKATIMQLQHGNESRLLNFTGLFILFFGIAVDLSLSLRF